jgi:NAD(P)-dependent dehydrogenase (short-subunit alcohol dehydrogenase family)
VYAAGTGVLQHIEEVDPELWIRLFRVDVIGAVLVTSACLRHLGPDAVCAYLASRTLNDATHTSRPPA